AVVVVRIRQIRLVVSIASVIKAWIAIAIIVINQLTCRAGIDRREHSLVPSLAWHCEVLTLLDQTCSTLSYDLSLSGESACHSSPVVVDSDLVKTRLLQINRTAGSGYFKQAA